MGLLHRAAQIAEEYLAALPERRVGASLGYEDVLAMLDGPLPEAGDDADGRCWTPSPASSRAWSPPPGRATSAS